MTDLLQLVFAGLSQGAVYALIAIGFVSIFTVSGVINLAQGEFAALAGLVAISAVGSGLPLFAAAVLAVITVAVVAVLMERLAIAPVKRMTTLVSLILTLGISTALKALMLLIYGPNAEGLTPITPGGFNVAGVSIRYQELWILGEDSGLEVEGLGGRPGIRSARFAGARATDEENVRRLLDELAAIGTDGRRARYVSELVFLSPELEEFRGTGTLSGRIAEEDRKSVV